MIRAKVWITLTIIILVAFSNPGKAQSQTSTTTTTSAHTCSYQGILVLGPTPRIYPQGTFPINATLATNYADQLITDYNSKITHTQASEDSGYFWLYLSTGQTFKVLVGLDNNSGTEQLNFFFTRISGNTPLVYPFTNETGAEMRAFTAGMGQDNNGSLIAIQMCVNSGFGFEDVNSQSPYGDVRYPLIWIVNLTSVYNNTRANAETAAQEIYSHDAAQIPPPPNPFISFLDAFWVYILGVGAVVGFVTSLHYWRNNMWPFHRSKHPRKRGKK